MEHPNISIQKTYIQLTEDSAWFREAAERARRQDYRYYKLLAGGHDAMVTAPDKLVEIFTALI